MAADYCVSCYERGPYRCKYRLVLLRQIALAKRNGNPMAVRSLKHEMYWHTYAGKVASQRRLR